MSEAPANALVLEARCPICDEWTVTCRFWSNKLPEYGWEGDGDESKSCDCPIDDLGYIHTEDGHSRTLIDICCAAYDSYVNREQEEKDKCP